MKEFGNLACFVRSLLFRPSAVSLLALLIPLACITVDKYGNPIDVEEDPPERQYDLGEMKPRPEWSDADRTIPMVLAGIPEFPPEKFLLTNLPPVGNQGKQASGTAWAVGYTAASYYFRTLHNRKKYLCSPAFLYNQLNRGEDQGIEIYETLRLLRSSGCPDQKLMPYAEKDYLRRPGPAAFLGAGNYVIQGFGRVDFTDINQLRAHLLQNKVVMATVRITLNFLELEDRVWKNPAGPPVGRHTVAVVGYDHTRERVIIQNSVGEDWGDDGFAEIPYEWFIRLTAQAYVLW